MLINDKAFITKHYRPNSFFGDVSPKMYILTWNFRGQGQALDQGKHKFGYIASINVEQMQDQIKQHTSRIQIYSDKCDLKNNLDESLVTYSFNKKQLLIFPTDLDTDVKIEAKMSYFSNRFNLKLGKYQMQVTPSKGNFKLVGQHDAFEIALALNGKRHVIALYSLLNSEKFHEAMIDIKKEEIDSIKRMDPTFNYTTDSIINICLLMFPTFEKCSWIIVYIRAMGFIAVVSFVISILIFLGSLFYKIF